MILSKFSKYLHIILYTIFILEYILLVCTIDLLPILVCGFICGLFIIVNNRGRDENSSSVIIVPNETVSVISCIVLSAIIVLIAGIYFVNGLPYIWDSFRSMLYDYHIFRYLIYGLIYPIVISLFITYSITDVNPFKKLMINVFIKVLLITLFLGLFICMNWESYMSIAKILVNLF